MLFFYTIVYNLFLRLVLVYIVYDMFRKTLYKIQLVY